MSLYTPVTECRICGSRELECVCDLGEMALCGTFPKPGERVPRGPLKLVQCGGCGLVQLAHNYDPDLLYGEGYGYRSALNNSMVKHLQAIVRSVEAAVDLKPGDVVLDIGCNDGTLLDAYLRPGLKQLGIDPGAPAKGLDGQRFVWKERFPSDRLTAALTTSKQKCRAITSIACFYDLEDPVEFAQGVADILAPDGLWVSEQSYLPAMIAANSYDTVCHEHLEYYTVRDVAGICGKAGLRIIGLHYNDVNGGSFRFEACHQDAAYPAFSALDKIIASERVEFGGFRVRRDARSGELRALLTALRDQGKTVYGYGASTKGNTLLQFCGIGPELLPAILEVNEDKFGLVTPGTGIPIIPESEGRDKVDYLLVLPWHFRRNIIAREQAFLDSGRGLIFPLPRVEIVDRMSLAA